MSVKVQISGYGLVSPLGNNVKSTMSSLIEGQSRAERVEEWATTDGLRSHIGNFVKQLDSKSQISRDKRRTMSKMSEMLCIAATEALSHANLSTEELSQRRTMIIVGSTTGSAQTYADSHKMMHETQSTRGLLATSVFKCINSSVAANLGLFLSFRGPVISPSSACSTSTQAMVLGSQLIRAGICDIVLAGGADECHMTSTLSFDVAHAASKGFNDRPTKASRPFDRDRDGIVVSEGASLVVLESLDSQKSRNVNSQGQVHGGAYYADCNHMIHPNTESIEQTMNRAMVDANLDPKSIGYINAHATSTVIGDLAEANAVKNVFGKIPISSFKGHLGHSFAACGGIELIASLEMLKTNQLLGTLNLENLDAQMPDLEYITGIQNSATEIILSNNFAFGGMNASIIFSP